MTQRALISHFYGIIERLAEQIEALLATVELLRLERGLLRKTLGNMADTRKGKR